METGLIQTLAAGAIVSVSLVFLAVRASRTIGGTKRRAGADQGCGASEGCGCGSVARDAMPDVLDTHSRT